MKFVNLCAIMGYYMFYKVIILDMSIFKIRYKSTLIECKDLLLLSFYD